MRLQTIVYLVSGLIVLHMTHTDGYVYDPEDIPDDTIEDTEKRKIIVVQQPCNGGRQLIRTSSAIQDTEPVKEKPIKQNRLPNHLKKWLNGDSSFNWQMYLLKRRRPWLMLPNTRCYRQSCETSKDCCRVHNICDKSAKVCYDCWYGYPCKTSADCCQRYPRCVRSASGKGRCGA
ncbi:uncharacterized protein LOC135501934 isoform X2 [Lineus longissimus]|uniref:uncharacterized protein LOC135501934 isoform X2 n=1 Tax=Lineus longissimus TaxID=88925 RepID=UPI002B4CF6BF